jgi:hypothetical protein
VLCAISLCCQRRHTIEDPKIESTSHHSSAHHRDLLFLRSKVFKGLELIDSITGKKIVTLENGMTVKMSDLPSMSTPSFNVRAVVQGRGPASMKFELEGKFKKLEITDPFSLCGNKRGIYNKCLELGIGSHTIKTTIHRCRKGCCKASGSLAVSFTIAAVTPSPKVAPVVTPVVSPMVTPIAAPVIPPVITPASSPVLQAPVVGAPVTKAPAPVRAPTIAPKSPAPVRAPTNAPKSPAPVRAPTNAPKAPVAPPPPCNSTIAILEYINSITLSRRTLTLLGTTPEDRAAQAVANDTSLRVCTDVEKFRVRQRFSLLTLWFQQTGRPSWTNTSGWLSANECTWRGIRCNFTQVEGVVGLQETVIGLRLKNNLINGTLPPDLGLLTGLTVVDFNTNFITGTIPNEFGALTNIVEFGAHENALNGTLPLSLGAWNKIQVFDMDVNKLTGSLPTSLANWTMILEIYADVNKLVGTIPDYIRTWTKLKQAWLEKNLFVGSLPTGVCALPNLIGLFVDCNITNCTCCLRSYSC